MLIAVPTYNRPEIVKFFLEKTSGIINATPNLYLGFYDSSPDEKTKEIVKAFLGESIKYKRYKEGASEEKGYDILDTEGDSFDYIWFCSDRKVLKLERLLPLIEADINKGVDILLFSTFQIKNSKKTIDSSYEMGLRFFEAIDMAKTIIGKNLFSHMKNAYMKYYGSHFSIQASMMDYIGCHKFTAIQYNLRDQDVDITGAIDFTHEWGNNVVWQWSKSWCDTVDKLPLSFDAFKEEIIHKNYMFQFKKVIARRATGNEYRYKDIKLYKPYIERVTDSLLPLYLAKCFPIICIRLPYKFYKKLKTRITK